MCMLQEVTYSDDEFGSDYEAEYDADESEQRLLAPDDVGDDLTRVAATAAAAERAAKSDNLGTYPDPRLIATNNGNEGEPVDDTLRDEPVVAAHEQEDRELPAPRAEAGNGITATAQLGSDTETALQEAERIQHAPSVDMNEPTDASTSEEEEEDAEPPDEIEASARQPPRPLGQLAKPASIRSLSVPVVPAASLVDPSLLVPSNLRSTSVPVVPSNEIMGIHRQNSGRFRIETVSGANARHKSIVRLPSVEEMIDQGNVMEDDDESDDEEDSDGDSESDDATDTSPSSRLSAGNNSPKGRSSSFQKTLPPKISPVLRTKSQPFMVRLPSVIEVAAEEMQYIESMRDGESETKSNGDEKEENSGISDDETSREVKANEAETASAVQSTSPPLTDQETEPKDPEPAMNPVSSADVGALETTACVETKLQPEPASANEPAEDAMANNDPPEQTEEPDDDYEDDYDDPHFPDTTEQVAKLRDDVDGKQELLVDDEFDDFKGADETSYNDDEYEGETDDYADMQFEDESRRETELLLREAQLLIQKQHDDTVDRALLLASVKSESPDIPDQSEPPDSVEPTSFVSAAVAEAKVVEEELIQSTTGTELVAATAATNFEDQYGGDDEFTTADDDDEDVEFAQYGSDANETEDDDAGDDLRESDSSARDQKLPEAVARFEVRVSEAIENSVRSSAPQLISDDVTSAQVGISHPEATPAETSDTPGSLQPTATESVPPFANPGPELADSLQPAPAACESLPPIAASSYSPEQPGQVEESKATVARSSNSTRSLQVAKKKPITTVSASSTAAATQQKPTRVVATRPAAAAAPGVMYTPRASRPIPPTHAAAERRKVESVLKRERPRELRLKTQRAGGHSTSSPALSNSSPPRRTAQSKAEVEKDGADISPPEAAPSEPIDVAKAEAISPPGSPGREARRSPEKIAPYTPRVYVEEYEPPPPKAPVFRQKRVAKPKVEDARRKLLPVKSPPNLRIDLPSMDKTKRNWLFLNMFRHGDDVSKYEPFVPQLVSPGLPQSAGRPARPDSALQQTYASSQAQAIVAYERGLRSGRRLVQPPDPALRERERNWAPIKPHESAIPAYDSILDKFCTTVTSPVIQRQIYQTRHGDLSPQLAYVLEKRVERQWKARGTAEAFGAVSSSYKTDVVHSPSSVSSATGKRSP